MNLLVLLVFGASGAALIGGLYLWRFRYQFRRYFLNRRQHKLIAGERDKLLLRQIAEIRRPLHGLVGTQDVFQFDYRDSHLADYVEVVNHCSSHIIDKLNRIQFFTELTANKFVPNAAEFSPAALFDSVMESVNRAYPGTHLQVQIQIEKSLSVCGLKGYRELISRLIHELVSNAVRYSVNKQCSVSLVPGPQKQFPVRLVVQDSGPGLDAKAIAKVALDSKGSEYFYALGSEAGLGLAIVSEICRLTASQLDFTAVPGGGTTMIVDLSAGCLTLLGQKHEDIPGPVPTLHQEILVVEDEALARNLMATMMDRAGYQATFCNSGLEAIELCRTRDFGFIFMDIEMPGLNGWQTTEKIFEILSQSSTRPKPFIVGLSAVSNSALIEKAKHAGFANFYAKPLGLDHMCEVLREHGISPQQRAPVTKDELQVEIDWEDPNSGYALNLNKLYQHFGEDLSLCQVVLTESATHLPNLFNEILDAHQAQTVPQLKSLVHKLQGEFAILMADKGVAITSRMSSRGDINSVEFLSDLEDLTGFMEMLLTEISLISHERVLAA